jgi:glycosyltransferase involved in cell wall biosynthesis
LRTPTLEADNLSSYNAMAVGLPVVGFRTGCPTELIPTVQHGILVENANPRALAAGIQSVLALADQGRAMGERGADYAAQHLDIQASVDEFTRAYEQVARHRRPDRPAQTAA